MQLDMVVSIDILQFQPNWCRITACHAILLIGYYAKNGNPLRAWHFAESWIWYTTFFLSANVRTGFYTITKLCELSQDWLQREVLCPKISDKSPFSSTELTEMVSLNLSKNQSNNWFKRHLWRSWELPDRPSELSYWSVKM